ncbi:hypothetical protein NCLIV_052790 [Neospora caninum Liverpool]|uniref:TBC1 domain family member 5 homolog B n=1 Tax=Neospora caninum (strain Liverpool) TaxID=572307 RepID=F0VLA2_NEOCL|nr:hypothetical protein NCLIV_052790 [Neospora caninum Liverpool]CBZ54854.1 hypothetical protein NCLIV_052790 [Neospora caninum Liverpool]CEL69574.1 TPA: TBC1 domain family member 5 homolog B [Neospora caninum Liverpool]|eukprot:XP_003884882.1 hypothetical protein NCLIV_052790 [Neospora caninum Liverpool]
MSSPSVFSEGGASAPQTGVGSCPADTSFLVGEDDDGLPPLTVSEVSRLFEALTALPLGDQAKQVLATRRSDEEPSSGLCSESLSASSPFLRRILWPRYLGLLEGAEPSAWAAQVDLHRKKYFQLREEQKLSAKRLTALDPQKFHPLASTADNPWSQKQQNDSLMEEIWKDIERTFADRTLFCRDSTRKALQRILFTWSRQNPDVSYKQGMNELLAIFFLVCVREQVPVSSDSGSFPENVSPHVRVLLSANATDIEADAFSLFNALMNDFLMRAAYIPPPAAPKPVASPMGNILGKGAAGALGGLVGTTSPAPQTHQSAILWRCSHIFHSLLRKADSTLYEHLVGVDIQPQLFLLRWLRLLFSREFHVQDTIFIWDAIFADAYLRNRASAAASSSPSVSSSSGSAIPSREGTDLLSSGRASLASGASPPGEGSSSGPSYVPERLGASASSRLPLTDYFALAMLVFVRENLLASDETLCLRRLLKFPPIESLQPLILLALSLRSPQKPRVLAVSKPPGSSPSSSRHASSLLEDGPHKPPHHSPASAFEEGRDVDGTGVKGPRNFPSSSRARHSSSTEAPHNVSASTPVPSLNCGRALPPTRGDLYHVTTPQAASGASPTQTAGPEKAEPHHMQQAQAKQRSGSGGEEGSSTEHRALPRVGVSVGNRDSSEASVDGVLLGRHVEDIVATLKAAAVSEAAAAAEGSPSGRSSSSSSAPSPSCARSFSTQVALSSAISRLSLLQRILVGELPYSPSLFMAEEEALLSVSSPARALSAQEKRPQPSRASQLPSGASRAFRDSSDGFVDEGRQSRFVAARAERQPSEKRRDGEIRVSEEQRLPDEQFYRGRGEYREPDARECEKAHGVRGFGTGVTRGRNGDDEDGNKGGTFFSPSSLPVVGDSHRNFAHANNSHNASYSPDGGLEAGSHDGRVSGGIRATVL